MLLSEFAGKEIVNLRDGTKLGYVGDSDIQINDAGGIEAFIVQSRGNSGWFFSKTSERENDFVVIPWKAIKKIGTEVIIVDIDYKNFCSV